VRGHLLLTNCLEDELTRPNIELALTEDRLLWLDLQGTDDETLILLREVFKIHPLAVEDVFEFHQRPKIEDYDDFVSIVAYGARDLGDSMFPYLAAMDDRIDDLQDQIFESPKESQLAALFELKRQLVGMRKMVTPQRDMVSTMLSGVVPVPGMTAESERYIRDLYDHLIRISDMVDSYRDLTSGALEAYTSMVSNRLNDVTKQLTIIATVFLPLSFLTGFFGQNLGWLVEHIGSLAAFLIFGVGTELLAVIGLLTLFWRRGWMGRKKS